MKKQLKFGLSKLKRKMRLIRKKAEGNGKDRVGK